jgi:hypothetical protein
LYTFLTAGLFILAMLLCTKVILMQSLTIFAWTPT